MSLELNQAQLKLKAAEEAYRAMERSHASLPRFEFRHHAEEKIASLRLFIAQGRLLALKQCGHAHLACEGKPVIRGRETRAA